MKMIKELKRLVDHYCEDSGLGLEDLGELADVYHIDYERLGNLLGRESVLKRLYIKDGIMTSLDLEKDKKHFLKRVKLKPYAAFTFYEITEYEYYKEIVLYVLQ